MKNLKQKIRFCSNGQKKKNLDHRHYKVDFKQERHADDVAIAQDKQEFCLDFIWFFRGRKCGKVCPIDY